jgi:two-component system chemotaxis response regulator CheB
MVKKVRVLIVDDSATVRRFLSDIISEAGDMQVVGEARDGQEAIVLAARLQPDIISMDIRMPRLDGLAATRLLMQENPLPIVIVSGRLQQPNETADLAFLALQAGALAVLDTPPGRGRPDHEASRDRFLGTLRAMAGVSVVRRWSKTEPLADEAVEPILPPDIPTVIVMGASAGGPVALHRILGEFPADFPIPIAIVQHMAEGFIEGMIRWLDSEIALRVIAAEQNHNVRPGEVVIANGGAHLLLRRAANQVRVLLDPQQGNTPYLPSVDSLFMSVAERFGSQAMGVLLSGMGDDGARGLLKMREAGARTIVQSEDTCLVYGMPGAAVEMGAVEQIVPLKHIAPTIMELVSAVSNR